MVCGGDQPSGYIEDLRKRRGGISNLSPAGGRRSLLTDLLHVVIDSVAFSITATMRQQLECWQYALLSHLGLYVRPSLSRLFQHPTTHHALPTSPCT